jgi:hypothetical protein
MITQVLVFDDEKKIRISYDKPYFQITDEYMKSIVVTESQLESLKEMIDEILQTVNKRDWL